MLTCKSLIHEWTFCFTKLMDTSLSSYYLVHLWSLTLLTILWFFKHYLLWFPWHRSDLFLQLLLWISIFSLIHWFIFQIHPSPGYVLVIFSSPLSLSTASATSAISTSSPDLSLSSRSCSLTDIWMCHKYLKLSIVTFRGLVFKLNTTRF